MKPLITILLVVGIVAILIGIAIPVFISRNTKEPETKRKWTDPKFRD